MEESTRVPLIVNAPGGKARGQVSNALVELVDLYPTLADLAGLKAPSNLEGQSFAPLLDNPARKWKSAAFTEFRDPIANGFSVRTREYRYIEWKSPEGTVNEELYDSLKDPREFHNLAPDATHAKLKAQAQRCLRQGWKAARA